MTNSPGAARPRRTGPTDLSGGAQPSDQGRAFASTTPRSAGWIRASLAALPLYWLLVAYGTLQAQPDQVTDPDGWARFVSSLTYLAEHVATNVLGPVIAIFGTFALGALLVRSRAPKSARWGAGLAVTGHILFMVPGTISTFATPAIGTAYVSGNHAVMAVEFSPVLAAVIAPALLLAVAGHLLLGVALWRSEVVARAAGMIWVAGTLVFYIAGYALGMATTGASLPTQPAGAALMTVSSAWVAWTVLRRPRSAPPEESRSFPPAHRSPAGPVGR